MLCWRSTNLRLKAEIAKKEKLIGELWAENTALVLKVQDQACLIKSLSDDNIILGQQIMEKPHVR
jgi:hypothetical protein